MLRLSLVLLITFASGCADFIAPVNTHAQGCSSGADCLADEACVLRGSSKICLRSAALNRCDRNGILEGLESCDDGNSSNEDGCTNACQLARCGDGFLRRDLSPDDPEFEECEPGATNDWVANCRSNCRLGRRHGHLIAHDRTICFLGAVGRGQQKMLCGVDGFDPIPGARPATTIFDVPISGLLAPSLAVERSGWLLELSPGILGHCSGNDCQHSITLGFPSPGLRDAVFEVDSAAVSLSDVVLSSGLVESVITPDFCSSVRQSLFFMDWWTRARELPPRSFDDQDYGRLPFGVPRANIGEDQLSDVVALARSRRTACAAHKDGRVSCWGDPTGWGKTDPDSERASECEYVAPQFLEEVSDVVELEAEEESFIALRRDGTFYTWGRIPQYGRVQLARDTERTGHGVNYIHYGWNECERSIQSPFHHERSSPINQVTAAYCTHCLLEEGGSVYCRGMLNASNEAMVGRGNSDDFQRSFQNSVALYDQMRSKGWVELGLRQPVVELSRGLKESTVLCLATAESEVLCWGQNHPSDPAEAVFGDEQEPLGSYRLRPPQSVGEFLGP